MENLLLDLIEKDQAVVTHIYEIEHRHEETLTAFLNFSEHEDFYAKIIIKFSQLDFSFTCSKLLT